MTKIQLKLQKIKRKGSWHLVNVYHIQNRHFMNAGHKHLSAKVNVE